MKPQAKTHIEVPPNTPIAWAPAPGPQTEAFLCEADELLYGGAAGGGKTDFLLVAALEDVHEKAYKAVIFRRTYPELESSIIDRARHLIPTIKGFEGAKENTSKHEWTFPSRSRLLFRHLEDDAAAIAHRSAEYQFIGFDELTTFTKRQYVTLFSRLRTSHGHRLRIRAASNPGGPGHAWVLERWAPWLDEDFAGFGGRAKSGEVRYYLAHPDTGEDIWVPKGTPGAMSRCFIASKVDDNPHIDKGYKTRLGAQDPLTRKQLRDGDWSAKPAPKTFFNRVWAPIVESAPSKAKRCRGWDRAATEQPTPQYPDPDWTAGVKLSYVLEEDLFYIEHVERFRAGPGKVKNTIVNIGKTEGLGVEIGIPCDPAQAGEFEAEEYQKALRGLVVNTNKERGDKVTRARAVSMTFAPAPGQNYGKFRIVRGPWNETYLSELEDFPTKGVHDDQVDATSTAFQILAQGGGCESDGEQSSQQMLRAAGIDLGGNDDDDDDNAGNNYRWGNRW